jgi:pimeloyl-ACP methyl ester carboxylesterase
LSADVAACAKSFRDKGLDSTAYTTLASADDLEDLRRALKADKLDLLAFSYGSRLALAYLQRHGDHVGRVVLQGVNGPGLVLKRPSAIRTKLERIATLLGADESWRSSTDLLSAARTARDRLERTPARLTVHDRRTQQPVQLEVGRDGLDALVHLNLDDLRLPALLVSVAAGDDRVLLRFVEAAWNGLSTGTVGLLGRAVNCAADRPSPRWAIVREEAKSAPFGNPVDNDFLTDELCRAVGYTSAPVEFGGPVTSRAPVLMITGALDGTNPTANALDVARGFPNGVLLEVENAAHEVLPLSPVQEAVADWFRGRDVSGRRLSAPPPRFLPVDEASLLPTPRGR